MQPKVLMTHARAVTLEALHYTVSLYPGHGQRACISTEVDKYVHALWSGADWSLDNQGEDEDPDFPIRVLADDLKVAGINPDLATHEQVADMRWRRCADIMEVTYGELKEATLEATAEGGCQSIII